jgi:hypothetical protein
MWHGALTCEYVLLARLPHPPNANHLAALSSILPPTHILDQYMYADEPASVHAAAAAASDDGFATSVEQLATTTPATASASASATGTASSLELASVSAGGSGSSSAEARAAAEWGALDAFRAAQTSEARVRFGNSSTENHFNCCNYDSFSLEKKNTNQYLNRVSAKHSPFSSNM